MKARRRHFLQLAGGMMAAPLLSRVNAQAQVGSGKPPMRFLCVSETYGAPVDNRGRIWLSSMTGDFALTEDHLGSILQPLRNHVDKLIVISNMDNTSYRLTRGVPNHGGNHVLTGSRASDNSPAGTMIHPSLEVAIGRYLTDEYGLESPGVFPHLNVTDHDRDAGAAASSYDMNGNGIRAIIGHQNFYRALFGSGPVDAGSSLLELSNASQAMALGLVEERLQALRPQLRQSNAKQVIDAYQTSVTEVAAELDARAELVCSPPAPGGPVEQTGENCPHTINAIYHAFACNLTPSIFYPMGCECASFNSHGFLYDESTHPDELRGKLRTSAHSYSHSVDELSQLTQEVVRTWQIGLIADLVDRLSVTPDSDGSMMMDNTVIYLPTALGHATHAYENQCIAALAGKNTNLHTGRHVDMSGFTTNELLTTMAQGARVPLHEFGGVKQDHQVVAELNRGPIEKMLKEVLS